ncbi:hypothetical protein [Hymenobacter cellulosilyticus]|uniref:Uncharacterized protein n=1 Tax=Hymenobacter cellulosilyticus TaxID=2932248 RepID=A0A8T9PZ57_9BACT|nr:hypothetical protein [Hymenobacter cellulosilyticus]UOQ70377.1 hypothetical protein MUN79_16705 [Hymenobacter cellulosilyticus]
MKPTMLLAALTLLTTACGTSPEEQKAIAAVERHVQEQVGGGPITPIHSEAHSGHQEDAQGRNRSGYTVEYTFEMEPTPGKKEEVTAVYFADSAGNVMPSTK